MNDEDEMRIYIITATVVSTLEDCGAQPLASIGVAMKDFSTTAELAYVLAELERGKFITIEENFAELTERGKEMANEIQKLIR